MSLDSLPTNPEFDGPDTSRSPADIAAQADRWWRAYLDGADAYRANDAISDCAVWVIADSPHVDALVRLLHGRALATDVTALEALRRELGEQVQAKLRNLQDEGRL